MKKIIIIGLISLAFICCGYAQLNSAFTATGGVNSGINAGEANIVDFIGWRDCQQFMTSSYNWSVMDGKVQNVQTNLPGVELLLTIKCTNPITPNDTIMGTCAYNYTNGTNITDNNAAWFPEDTVQWKLFLDALVARYDLSSAAPHPPWLTSSITKWHIEQEWDRVWCSQYTLPTDTSILKVQEFVNYERMTYNEIKSQQVNSTISCAGITSAYIGAFYDGYYNQTTLCRSNDCITLSPFTQDTLGTSPVFLANRRNMFYLMRNAKYDELDVHQYGYWKNIADIVQWAKDSSMQNKPISFFEGGGPFCKGCDSIYHNVNDTTGILPVPLIRDNASYVVYYYITGIEAGVKHLNWNLGPEYANWGSTWGDLDLLSINYVPKPSFFTYRFLAKNIFANANADSVVQVNELDTSIYHFRIAPLDLHVIWSTNPTNSYIVNGNGTLYRWDIPTTCESTMPTYCDSIVQNSSINVVGSTTISLIDGVPVFYSWNNSIGIPDIADNQNQVKVYPNPTTGDFTVSISIDVPKQFKYELFDLTGKKILETNKAISPGNSNTLISTSNLSQGVYLLFVSGEGTLYQQKIIKY